MQMAMLRILMLQILYKLCFCEENELITWHIAKTSSVEFIVMYTIPSIFVFFNNVKYKLIAV
jgi:hypothetical protein